VKIVAFAASSSGQSINKKLAGYAAGLFDDADVDLLDLNDYELPLFSEDKEKELEQPQLAHYFLAKIAGADALIISFAEHNGTYSTAYKNLFDWCSRIKKLYQNKPMVLLSTSSGARGGASVLEQSVKSSSFFDGEVRESLAVPNFYDHFDMAQDRITDDNLNVKLAEELTKLKS
jgi:chromate reductase, NAD(P)H dehydrogenase (quinone)